MTHGFLSARSQALLLMLTLSACTEPEASHDAGSSDGALPLESALVGIAQPQRPVVLYQDFDGCILVPALTTTGETIPLTSSAPGFAVEATGAVTAVDAAGCNGIRLHASGAGMGHVVVRVNTTFGTSTAEFDARIVSSTFRLTALGDGGRDVIAIGGELAPWDWVDVTFDSPDPEALASYSGARAEVIIADGAVLRPTESVPPRVVGVARGSSNVRVDYRSALRRGEPLMGRTVVVAGGTLVDLRGVDVREEREPTLTVQGAVAPGTCLVVRGAGTFADGADSYQAFTTGHVLTTTPADRLTQRSGDVWCVGEEEGEVTLRLCVEALCAETTIGVFAPGTVESLMATRAGTPIVMRDTSNAGFSWVCLPHTFTATLRGVPTDVTTSSLLRFNGDTTGLRHSVVMGGRPCAYLADPPSVPATISIWAYYTEAGTELTFEWPR